MKIILIIIFQFLPLFLIAQRKINKADIIKINTEIENEVLKLNDSLIKADKYIKPFNLEFKSDIYKIEKLADKKISIDYSTAVMTDAVYELEKGYDKLLNKYYKILYSKLKTEDKEKLKISQKNWIKFRDSERIMIGIVSQNEYSGGGTIQSNLRASRICEITSKRVFEIKKHIDQFIE